MPFSDIESRIAAKELKPDEAQRAAARSLARLAGELEAPETGLGKWLKRAAKPAARGIYLWGPVGRGKTMLMDAFFAEAAIDAKRRVHFHAFMQDVHRRLHGLRKSRAANDAIAETGRSIAREARLLCLDEMQIADIADATIVGRLFETLFAEGVAVVTTSNLPPDRLYENGLNRHLFLPFVRLLREKLERVPLDGLTDYRLGRIKSYESFVTPLGPAADAKIQSLWRRLTDTEQGEPANISVNGRMLAIPQAARGAARFGFSELCEAPLGPADYLALAAAYGTVFCERIPALARDNRNEAKRFILLIDTLYDARRRFVASSARPPVRIHEQGDHAPEFARTVSRLEEMQSAAWWGAAIADT